MKLDLLVCCSEDVASVASRSAKIRRLSDFIRSLSGREVDLGIRYLCGTVPQSTLAAGPALIREIAQTAPAPCTSLCLTAVDQILECAAKSQGKGSSGERKRWLKSLMEQATAREQGFLVRLISGQLRQGALEGVMLEAVADASGIAGSDLRRALAVSGDIGAVGAAAINDGAAGVGRFRLQIFRPLLPMLAQSAESTDAAIVQLGESAWEYKLDGVRIQVHKSGEEVRVFTRHLKDISAAVPDIVEFARALPVRAAILDGEALALKESGRPHPFQVTMRRFGRRQAVEAMRKQLPLTPVLFDCLHLDGHDLIDAPAVDRWASLASAVPAASQIPRRITGAPDGASAFLNQARAQGHEGLVAKAPDQPYLAGARGGGWLKIKPFHSLDLVILAAEWGSGRRRGSLSNLHLGARDPATGTFVMLGKTFKGLTDDMLSWQTRRLLELETGRDGQVVYVRPECVVEVAFDGVQASPTYPSGAALRFARVKRHRDDKQADQADDVGAVLDILRSQHSEQDCCAATVT